MQKPKKLDNLTISLLNNHYDGKVGTSHWTIDVKPSERWLIGSFPELINPDNQDYHSFRRGTWHIYSFYDHQWSIWASHHNHNDDRILTYIRETEWSAHYGFVNRETVKATFDSIEEELAEYLEENREEGEEESELTEKENIMDERCRFETMQGCAETYGGHVNFGRGDAPYDIYMDKNKDGIVTAWALLLDDFYILRQDIY